MKFLVRIEGGFTGIPREFTGETALPKALEQQLLSCLQRKPAPPNTQLRDSRLYFIRLQSQNEVVENSYDELNLPEEVRHFISLIEQER